MRTRAWGLMGVLGLVSAGGALAQDGRMAAAALPSPDNVYRDRDYRPGTNNEGVYKPGPERSGWAVVIDLRKRTRTTFEQAQAQKARGDAAAACKSIRKAIKLDRRFVERRNSVAPDTPLNTDESHYRDIEAEYCGTERG